MGLTEPNEKKSAPIGSYADRRHGRGEILFLCCPPTFARSHRQMGQSDSNQIDGTLKDIRTKICLEEKAKCQASLTLFYA